MTPVTAVIAVYYREREENLSRIIDALDKGTHRPERIIIWDNRGRDQEHMRYRFLAWGDGVELVTSSWNTLHGRYAACMIAESPFIYIQDDDLIPGPELVDTLLVAAKRTKGAIVGPLGVKYSSDLEHPYTKGLAVAEGPADVIKGRCRLAARYTWLHAMSFPMEPMGRNDDILISHYAGINRVVPVEFTDIPENGVGLSHDPQHFAERDACVRQLLGRELVR